MRTIFITIVCLLFFSLTQYGQTPNQFKYQAVIRDANGQILSNQEVYVNISILQSSAGGSSVFDEVHFVNTNEFGLINIIIGSKNDLSVIDWSSNIYFLEVSVNGSILGTTQLLSVPYAVQAKYVENNNDADADPNNEIQNLNLNGTFLEIDNGAGAELGVLQDGTGTDDQLLDLSVNLLSIEDGNSVDLNKYLDNTDNQALGLSDNILSIAGGNTVDLSSYLDNTDEQELSLNGTALEIINGNSVDLSSIQDGTGTDDQLLDLTVNLLSIEDGNSVDLSSYIDNTDEQDLSLNGTALEITNGNSVDLSSIQDGTGTDDQTLLEVLSEGNDAGNNQIVNLGNPVNDLDAVTKAYVDSIRDELIAMIGVTDIDGNHYPMVVIGDQIWMAENLKVTHYANGTEITYITDNTTWGNLPDNNTADAYCFYNNNINSDYGAIYTWAAAMNGNSSSNTNPSGIQGVCPDGWHLPSMQEWQELFDYLGGPLVAGGKLKEIGFEHWDSPNTNATNESGFKAIPGGSRNRSTGVFSREGLYGYFWTSVDDGGINGYYIYISYNNGSTNFHNDPKSGGYSVRCVKD